MSLASLQAKSPRLTTDVEETQWITSSRVTVFVVANLNIRHWFITIPVAVKLAKTDGAPLLVTLSDYQCTFVTFHLIILCSTLFSCFEILTL